MHRNPEQLARLDVRLETERFVVRTLCVDDVGPGYAAWFEDPAVRNFIAWRPKEDALAELRGFVNGHDVRDDSLLLGIFSADGQHVANLKYEPIDLEERTAVLGILIGDPSWRGKGLFGEVFSASALLLRQRFGILRILLGVDGENAAALAAYKRSGFRLVPRDVLGGSAHWMECRIG